MLHVAKISHSLSNLSAPGQSDQARQPSPSLSAAVSGQATTSQLRPTIFSHVRIKSFSSAMRPSPPIASALSKLEAAPMPRYARISQLTWVAWRNSLRNLDVRYAKICRVHWKGNNSIGNSYYSSRAAEITSLLTTQGNLRTISFTLSTLASTLSAPLFWLINPGLLSWRRQDSSQRRTRDFTI